MDLVEGFDFEAKRATGRNGQGQLPESFFPSYSAMANTEGGVVLLGVDEVGDDKFEVVGIPNTTKVLGELWSGLNNRQKVNCNLLSENDVEVITVEGKSVIRVTIPRALRFQMPVCVGRNPFDGTYRRQGQGDFRCDEETVKRMLGEQIEDARDAQLLERFTIADLHAPTIRAYRAWSYEQLAERVDRGPFWKPQDCLEHVEGAASDGTKYQMEFNVCWDDKPNAEVRVSGDLSAEPQRPLFGFIPIYTPDVADSFIMTPDGQFIGEMRK